MGKSNYGYPSHDHLHCTECNAIIEFNSDDVRRLREALGVAHGFRPTGHRLIITGICPQCQRARSPRRRLDLI